MSADTLENLAADPRVFVRRGGPPDSDGVAVIYWMQRAQRALDNSALDIAIAAGNLLRKPVVAYLAPVPFYPHANLRHFAFLQQGLADIADGLRARGAGFVLRRYPDHSLENFCTEVRPCLVVGDENPLRGPEAWRQRITDRIRVPFWTVDADVVVPSRLLGREHYAARTIRPRIVERLDCFLIPCGNNKARVNWRRQRGLLSLAPDADLTKGWNIDRAVLPVSSFRGGTREGLRRLRAFLRKGLKGYSERRNHPEIEGSSRLSPYLHFGHLGPHTVALAVQKADAPRRDRDAFLEQLIVRRELAVNFVRFNPDYDTIESAEPWAHRTLAGHTGDLRSFRYSERQFENAETHDELWNAAQLQMVKTGWMHGYLRMYWAKKILEWSASPAVAYQTAVRLNDKYELDGRDPSGYAGIAWAVAGKHDRPWFTRPVFGMVRAMTLAGVSNKFDVEAYIRRVASHTGRR